MTVTDGPTSTPQTPTTNHTDQWTTDAVNVDEVARRLTALWLHLEGPRPLRLSTTARDRTSESEPVRVVGSFARTNTVNLIICARTPQQGTRARAALESLPTHYPTRAIVVIADPELDREAASGTAAGKLRLTASLVNYAAGNRSGGHFEVITIEAGPRALGNPVNSAVPLTVPDLPTFVWWTGDLQYDLGLFRDLVDVSDRVIVDSAAFGDFGRGLAILSDMEGDYVHPRPVLSDFAWARLRDWRHLIAQFYDAPANRNRFETIDSVTVEFVPEATPEHPVSGQSSAMMLVSWLASRLGWRVEERLARTAAGLRMVFHNRGTNGPVIVHLKPVAVEKSLRGLRSVELTMGGSQQTRFIVRQASDTELQTISKSDGTDIRRLVLAMAMDDGSLLEGELQQFSHDHVYADALLTAARIFSRR